MGREESKEREILRSFFHGLFLQFFVSYESSSLDSIRKQDGNGSTCARLSSSHTPYGPVAHTSAFPHRIIITIMRRRLGLFPCDDFPLIWRDRVLCITGIYKLSYEFLYMRVMKKEGMWLLYRFGYGILLFIYTKALVSAGKSDRIILSM